MTLINTMILRQKKKKAIDDAESILDKATREHRGLTAAEDRQLDGLQDEIGELSAKIENADRNNAFEMASASGNSRTATAVRGELTEEDRAFLRFVRKGPNALSREERALVEDAAGQYLVSPAIEMELQRTLEKLSVVRRLASNRMTDKDRIKVIDITEASMGWGKLETGTVITESTPAPSAPTYKYVEDLYGLVKIGEDELEDADWDLIEFLGNSFGRAINEAEELAFLKGVGHDSNQPEGICVDATLLENALTTAASGEVTIEDFLQCIYQIPAKYRQGSSWIVNSTLELELRKLRPEIAEGYFGNFFWQPSLIEGRPNTFLGYSIYNSDEGMDELNDTEGVLAVFGNFQMGYRITDRKQMTIQRLDELYAEAGLVGFKCHKRLAGYPIKPSNKPLVLLKEHA